MSTINEIKATVLAHHPDARVELIDKAYDLALSDSGNQAQLSAILEAAQILAILNMEEVTVAAALLFARAADQKAVPQLAAGVSSEAAEIAGSVARLVNVRYSSSSDLQAENFRRLVLSMARDVRVVMIILALRLQMMRHLDNVEVDEQRARAFETLEVYAPLANRLGLYRLKSELEDLGLKYTEPHAFSEIEEKLGSSKEEYAAYISEVGLMLEAILNDQKITGEVNGRTKHIYSIHKKMIEQNIPFEKVYDRIAFRVIVGELRDCYAVLGAVHARWTPVAGRFKDYIALPKPNLYQSLHTTVMGPRKEPMEVQIRTFEMHRIAEEGIAAHWRYKEKRAAGKEDRIFQWLRKLVESSRDLPDDGTFVEEVQSELYPDTVYVFSPAGEVIELPKGSTPVDFAFTIHSQVGYHCVGAKVNDRMVQLNHVLKNGDRVEIITSKNQTPSPDWLEFVKSSKAKNRIRQIIRTEQRQRAMALGNDICEREFRKVGRSFQKIVREGMLGPVADRLGFNKEDEITEAVGFGKLSARTVLEKVYPEYEQKEKPDADEIKRQRKEPKKKKGIIIRGVGDTMVRFAKCCNPLPMEPIEGFITRGQGLTIHTADCPNITRADPERRIEVEWGIGDDTEHQVRISVSCADKKGMLANITQALAANDVNVTNASVKTFIVGRAECIFDISVGNINELNKILRSIQSLKDVYSVRRLKT